MPGPGNFPHCGGRRWAVRVVVAHRPARAAPGARRAGCAGARSTSTGACYTSCATAPPPGTGWWKAHRRPPPAPVRSSLDKHTVQVRREHRHHQAAHRARRLAVGKMWRDSGYVSVRADGSPIHPGYASCPFRLLITMTPGWYPRGTHRPHPTDHKGWPSRKQQATRLMMLRARRDSNPQPSDP